MYEKWRDIKGYEGLYQISNLGNIKSLTRIEYTYNYLKKEKIKRVRKEKLISSNNNVKRYKIVSLTKNGKTKTFTIHRLVAQTFIPNPENKPQVNHINGIKTDNRVENLEWCSASENIIHAYKNNLLTSSQKQKEAAKKTIKKAAKAKRRKVYQLTMEGKKIKLWNSMYELYKKYNYSWGTIRKVCIGQQEFAYGYKWKYKEN